MKINKKVKDKIQDLLFEFRLGTEDMQPQQHIRYSMFDTPGPNTPGNSNDEEVKVDIIKPSEISPMQLHSVAQNIDKVPDNVIELKNTINHIFSKLGNNEITQEQIAKIYNTVLDVVGKD
jgi:hypothetical protein